jgi:phosphohistidine swiveling domain-containing protein
MFLAMGAAGFAEADLEAAVRRLSEGSRLRDAEAQVAAAAPALQLVLAGALAEGGWFEGAHRQELERAAAIEDAEERVTAIATLIAEETRVAMMVGVAVGWALADELGPAPEDR